MTIAATKDAAALARTLRRVIALNVGMVFAEVAVALAIGSVSLFADSIDFFEDASINLLILAGLAWSARARARLGMGLAGIILVPGLATLAMAWLRVSSGTAPDPAALSATGCAALAVNGACALMLARHRAEAGSMMKAAFLSARNDTLANVAIIAAGIMIAVTRSPWPDLVVGLAIAALNAGAAREVWVTARAEHRSAEAADTVASAPRQD